MASRPATALAILILFALATPNPALAQEKVPAVPVIAVQEEALPPPTNRAHAIAMHGKPKYPADFEHLPYANPGAPKGGTLRLSARGSYDSFNPYIAKGDPGAGASAETLLTRGEDEAFTEYGLIAESLEWPEDRSWVTFTLRPEARWHDGEPITVEDVIFSLETIKEQGSPVLRFYFQDVLGAEKVGERRVKFTFGGGENLELPLIVGGDMPILPKHYWETRDFSATTLEPPLSSGPYRIADFEPGRFVTLQRVEDYWGKDLPINRGRYNYDTIRYDYFRDETVVREALKAGSFDFFSENSAKEWATTYNVPVVHKGWLVQERFEDHSSGQMQGFCMNTRRPYFQDRKLRRAFAYAYDFAWTNEHIYYGQYVHPNSYFYGTELAAEGLPTGQELEILEPYRGRVPDEVFAEPYTVPETDGSGWPRDNLEQAFALLEQAGWVVRDMRLVNAETGEPFPRFEFLYQQQGLERAILPFLRNLKRLGIDAKLRLVDSSQYINRLRSFDFDMIVCGSSQSLSPGNEQRFWWSSAAAEDPGSRNFAGIKDPVVDELIELVIRASDRETLVAATRALDRVLLWGHYVVPNLAAPFDRLVYWNKFSRPEMVPLTGPSIYTWWIDEAKAEALRERQVQAQGESEGEETAEAERGGGEETADSGRGGGNAPIGAFGIVVLGLVLVGGILAVRHAMRGSHG